MSPYIGSIQLSDETFLPRVQETRQIEHVFVAFRFLKVIELMSREGDSRNVTKISHNNGAQEFETVRPFFRSLKGNFY